MRQIFLSAAFLLAAGSAMASSIEVIGATTKASGSIITESCDHCPPLQTKVSKKDYSVPELRSGTFQQSEVRDVDGEKKIYRTEGWMGGSPVLFVSKATPEQMLVLAPPAPAEGIDSEATAAVIGGDAKPVTAGMVETAPMDVSGFQLRF